MESAIKYSPESGYVRFKVAPFSVPPAAHTRRFGGDPEALLRTSFFPFEGLPAPVLKEGSKM